MKFARSMKNHLSPGQFPDLIAGSHPKRAPVYVQQLPKVMGFSGKSIASGIFKVVYRVDFMHVDGALGEQGKIGHGKNSFLTLRVFLL